MFFDINKVKDFKKEYDKKKIINFLEKSEKIIPDILKYQYLL